MHCETLGRHLADRHRREVDAGSSPADLGFWSSAVVDAIAALARPGSSRRATSVRPHSAGWRSGRRGLPTGCGSSSSTTGGGASSRSATDSPTPRVRDALDASFYDLLASEARLASFVAIAKGDVPQHHWFHLGRLVTNVDGRATLMSWGGTMFEYLMPLLLMRSFPGTLLDQSCRASVRRQIEYGRGASVPWGISESAYAFTDRAGNYQYQRVRRPRPRAEARAGRRSRHRAVRHRAGQPRRSRLPRPRTSSGSPAPAWMAGSGSTKSIDYQRPARRRRRQPAAGDSPGPTSCARSSLTTRACRSSRSPTSSATTCSSRGSTPTRASRRPSCCSRSASRAKPSSRSRVRRKEPTGAAVAPVFASRRFRSPHTTSPHTHFLSNGRYTAARHPRRRRVQHVARPRGHAPARGPDLRRRCALHLPARSLVG